MSKDRELADLVRGEGATFCSYMAILLPCLHMVEGARKHWDLYIRALIGFTRAPTLMT